MNTIELRDKYEVNLGVIEKLKNLIPSASDNYKKVIIESIEKVKEENNEIIKKIKTIHYNNLSKKDFNKLMRNDRPSKKFEGSKKSTAIEIPENKKEIVIEKEDAEKLVSDVEEKEEEVKIIIEPKVEKKIEDITEELKKERIPSEKLRDAKIVFDGTYKLIYDGGKGIYEQDIYEFILDHNISEQNTVYNFNIIKLLKDFDMENNTNLYNRYMENKMSVEYNFDKTNVKNYNEKLIKKVKEIAKRENKAFDNVTVIDNSRKFKFRKGLVVAAAVGLAVLGSFGLRKIKKTADTSASTINNTVQESVIENTEEVTESTTEKVTEETKIEKEEVVVTTSINDDVIDEEKEEIKEDNSLKIGDTYSFESTDLYYASTDEIPRGNTKYINGNYEYKATMISVVYKNQVMELVYQDSINLDELNKICKEKYGDDVKISVNFDLVDTEGNVVTKYVGWVNGEDTQAAVKVLK